MTEEDVGDRHFLETYKHNWFPSTHTSTRKSPKPLKKLVFPIKEYYEAAVEVTPNKPSSEMFSKESSNSAQTQQKEFAEFARKRFESSNQSDANMFNKSDICQTKNFLNDKLAAEQKKQVSFVKQRPEGNVSRQSAVFLPSKKPITKAKVIVFKSALAYDMNRKSIFGKPVAPKRNRNSELVPPTTVRTGNIPNDTSMHWQDLFRRNKPIQKQLLPSKNHSILMPEHVMILMKDEEFISRFLESFTDELPIDVLFAEYIAWANATDFEQLLNKIRSPSVRSLFKVSLIYERMAFYICYFIYARDLRKEEIIFLKKITVHIYLNFVSFVQELHSQISEVR